VSQAKDLPADVISDLLEDLDVAVCMVDRAGRIAQVSHAIERITGYGVDELVGKPAWTLAAPDSVPIMKEQLRRKMSGEARLTRYELTGRRKDGTTVPLQVSCEPLWEARQIVGARGIVHVAGRVPGLEHLAGQVSLTPRQLDVLSLLAEGLSTRAIAERLSISPETTRNHVRSILMELRVHSRLEAVVVGRRLGLVG
jgi:PAS domain S-box-containing protein